MRMSYPSKWGISILGVCLSMIGSLAGAKVTARTLPASRVITGPNYEATVAGDGCLTNLRIGGEEFLAPGVSISRGSYFYYEGALKHTSVEQPEPHVIVARSDVASVRYEFSEEGMVWTVKNNREEAMPFFIVFATKVEAVMNEQNEMRKTVINEDWEKTTWFRGKGRLEIIGGTKQWGPWEGSHQVWEASLAPGEERRIELVAGLTSDEEALRIKQLEIPLVEKDLTVLSPRNWQVFQRQSREEGPIIISGRTRLEADEIEVRITGKSLTGKLPGEWRVLPFDKDSRSFSVAMSFPAGGWYCLEARSCKDGKIVAESTVEKFGVGEVFVGAGQSNSTNCGQFKTKQTSGMVSSFSGEHWQPADDPQPGPHDKTQGGSFWPAFGDAMAAKYGVPIGVATTGHGGTSVVQWQPDGELFSWTMTRIHQLAPMGFRALLWHQGESDVERSSEEYYGRLKEVILASKAVAGWEFPWFVAQVSYHNPDKPSFASTREAQERLWKEGVALEGPDTDQLTGDCRDYDGKGIHFSPKGLKIHGEMWAEKVAPYLDRILKETSGSVPAE